MKLFLASSLDQTISGLAGHLANSPAQTKVLFIANAADPYPGDKFWVKLDRDAFLDSGYLLNELDVKETTKEDFVTVLNNSDVLHICGGSVLYLISLLRERGLASLIVDAVKSNKVVYTGTSAGSMIPAEKLDLCQYDQEEQDFAKGTTDFKGLGLVNFLIMPHSNQATSVKNHKIIVEHMAEDGQPLIFLRDNEAIFVEDSNFEIYSV